MDTITSMVDTLVARGYGYEAGDAGVYFRVKAVPTYGELSKLSREEMIRITGQQDDSDVDDPRKEDPLDFALWKRWSGSADEPHWPSAWGEGRPGWHIECSAMCRQHLGEQITVHGGGADLIYPHHESEIAQSEQTTGKRPFVNFWMHSAMVYMDGEKMSKSLGNMVFIRDLIKRYSADDVRYYLLSHHYSQVFEWNEAELVNASAAVERLALAAGQPDVNAGAEERFRAALADNFGTPGALEALDQASGDTLRRLSAVLGFRLT
jgi:L-cysteine:1D-myo-inositol 2-amino-2-deoxy-alpha-D-glucopyranoside ligase